MKMLMLVNFHFKKAELSLENIQENPGQSASNK